MESFINYRNSLVNKNRIEFSAYPNIKWLNEYQAVSAQKKREKLTEKLKNNWLFNETKPFHKQISKGCSLCGQGTWSCVFITGKCNAKCFYCPASQEEDCVPTSQNLHFETPESYAEYINYFKFKGVSFSGGEPLLFLDRTLQYLEQIRKDCSPEIYIWMYTNGILASEEKFRKLASAGLNEVRFDIGATHFSLEKIAFAKGIIPNITIEIPAVPEEKARLIQLLPEMIKAGVTNLNLHQLRLTKHNAPKLLKHNYTFIHAEQPVVLESELAALEILSYAFDNNLEIGINYCSFFFKNRFQKAGFRKQVANALAAPNEIITEKGFIRNYSDSSISYNAMVIFDKDKALINANELQLIYKNYHFKSETALKPLIPDKELKNRIDEFLIIDNNEIPKDEELFKIWQMEKIESGLREY
ncbi:MAG TPA: radical SAM protein [Draconibacterium sp.]|nr:radical SAM protein [Draconibacterium sp.]